MKIKYLNRDSKKGQIPATITWVPAVFILGFFLIIFLFIGLSMFDTKDVEVRNAGKSLSQANRDLAATYVLITLLESKVNIDNREITLKQAIEEWSTISDITTKVQRGSDIKKVVKNKLEELSGVNGRYYIYFAHDIEEVYKDYGANPNVIVNDADYQKVMNYFYMVSQNVNHYTVWPKSSSIYLPENKIRVGLYMEI